MMRIWFAFPAAARHSAIFLSQAALNNPSLFLMYVPLYVLPSHLHAVVTVVTLIVYEAVNTSV